MRTPLQKGEKVLLVTYSSWVSLTGPVLFAMIALVASYFIGFSSRYGWVAALIGLVYAAIRYFTWKVNIWVVTNFRVIDEAGLINHFAKESPLEKINNVSYDQSVWGRVFNFGHVEIQTAAQIGATDYYNVNHPKRLKDTITSAQSEFKNYQTGSQAIQLASALGHLGGGRSSISTADELQKLFDLKQKGILSEEEFARAKNKLLNN